MIKQRSNAAIIHLLYVGDFHLEMVGTFVHLNIMLMVMFMVQSKFMNVKTK